MSAKYSKDFKKEVVDAYIKSSKSYAEIAAEFNISKTSIRDWTKKYSEECQYTTNNKNNKSNIDYVNADYMNTELAIKTLNEALIKEKRPKNLILHSDQMVQFISWEFVKFCKDNNIIQSMSRAGCPYDNAPMERFYNTFKNCFYYKFTFDSVEMLDKLTKQYINWCNYVRPHTHNNNLTPMELRFS